MTWRLPAAIDEILKKGRDFKSIWREEALTLMSIELQSKESYALMETANRMSCHQFANKGESHFHIGLNVEPCSMDWEFCSLTRKAGIFKEKMEFPEEDLLQWARQGEIERLMHSTL